MAAKTGRRLNFGVNPIIVKELRSRMRGPRAFLTLTGVLLGLGLVSYGLFQMVLIQSRYSSTPLSPQIGQTMFAGLALLELLIICLLTPSVTATAISGEQEKLTYEMLLATPLRPGSILWGKLISALSYIFLLVFAAIPMASLVFIFGGVSPREMIKALLVLVLFAVFVGIVGLFFSALLRRSGRATVASYLVVLALLGGPTFASMTYSILRGMETPRWLLIPSPIATLVSAIQPSVNLDGPSNLFWMIGGGMLGPMIQQPISQTAIPRPLYHYSLPLFGLIGLVLYLLSSRLVLPTRRWRLPLKTVLTWVLLIGGYCAVIGAGFWVTRDRYENSIFNRPAQPAPFGMAEPAVVQQAVAVEVQAAPADENAVTAVDPANLNALSTDMIMESMSGLPVEEEAEIYAAVIRQVYTVDHTFESAPNFPVLYLISNTDDSVGDPEITFGPSQPFSGGFMQVIGELISDLPTEVRWVTNAGEVAKDPQTGAVDEGGAIITLGNIHVDGGNPVLVSASLYFSSTGAMGKTYVLEKLNGVWQITGSTGNEWMS